MSEDRCVCCGEVVPEGRMVCPNCEKQKPMKNLSHGEMVQIAEERKDLVKVVRCKNCEWWDKKKRVCEHPEWVDMDGWHKCSDADDYCFRAERKEKNDD